MIAELLRKERPYWERGGSRKKPLNFRIVEKNVEEIDRAREMGYSWTQIRKAFDKAYPEAGRFGDSVERFYHQIKKEEKK